MTEKATKSEKSRVEEITQRLSQYFGEPVRPKNLTVLDILIETILSQNTNDRNRDVAFRRLKERFSDWEAVRQAPAEAVEEAIRPAGLAPQKAPRIQGLLNWAHETFGTLNLEFICTWPEEKALKTLTGVKGVGVKTASVVLMLACQKDVFPVDTHIHRIAKRLRLIPEKASAEKAHALLAPLIPQGKAFSLHINLLRLGRTICRARNPQCEKCPLRDLCPSAEKEVK